ncbi:hypothetical protein XBJ2_870044 [Xenorhabdus bovienii str. Jollieti]|nr:hypothetical protein XBJ2_870044 [Xenorhabdus bovienii str. Jollieti]
MELMLILSFLLWESVREIIFSIKLVFSQRMAPLFWCHYLPYYDCDAAINSSPFGRNYR